MRKPVPPCFKRKDYLLWARARFQSKFCPSSGFCWDCIPEYKAEMEKQGKCTHPETTFVCVTSMTDGEATHEIKGIWPSTTISEVFEDPDIVSIADARD